MTDLFSPFDLGSLSLPNRIAMSAMTRTRASESGVPTDLMRDYYVQRASAGLIVTECTQVSDQGHGIIRAPGLHRPDQIAAWRKITDAVHVAGGRSYCQIWHCGRVAHPDIRDGVPPVGPSPIAATGDFVLPTGRVDFTIPRELSIDEIPGIVADFAKATENAREAGFDGVELHGANGYLQDQFLQDGSNHRTDAYGGTIENRAKLLFEVVDGVADDIGKDRVGVRLSPHGNLGGLSDSDTVPHFSYVIAELSRRKLAYLHLIEPRASSAGIADDASIDSADNASIFRELFAGPVITAGGYTATTGAEAISAGLANAVAFGRMFIANPDLVERIRLSAPLNAFDRTTSYGGGARGYTDYPRLMELADAE